MVQENPSHRVTTFHFGLEHLMLKVLLKGPDQTDHNKPQAKLWTKSVDGHRLDV